MDTTVICPDCGGVIGGKLQPGQKPCTCDPSNESGSRPGMPDPVAKPKVCCKCGKDIASKKRFRDSLGYWCEACHYEEKRSAHAGHVPCDGCGRYVEERKLVTFEKTRICTRCLAEKRREAKAANRILIHTEARDKHEKQKLLILGVVALVLLMIILFASLKVHQS
jgi:hypothetical protein